VLVVAQKSNVQDAQAVITVQSGVGDGDGDGDGGGGGGGQRQPGGEESSSLVVAAAAAGDVPVVMQRLEQQQQHRQEQVIHVQAHAHNDVAIYKRITITSKDQSFLILLNEMLQSSK